jgi:hypothetical protein
MGRLSPKMLAHKVFQISIYCKLSVSLTIVAQYDSHLAALIVVSYLVYCVCETVLFLFKSMTNHSATPTAYTKYGKNFFA